MTYVELAIGLVLLLAGGEALVRGSVAVATRLGVSPLVIGLTLVGFGTSTPELVASIQAALIGAPGIAVGNIVGSNIANILLILGIAAVLMPVRATRDMLKRDGVVLLVVSLVMVGIVLTGYLSRPFGIALLAALLLYTGLSFWLERRRANPALASTMETEVEAEVGGWPRSLAMGLVLAVGGIAGVVIGADFLVDSAVTIAESAGISQAVIGLTIVAVGTSLPELVTSVMAAIRRHSDVALGNVVGSNIFNILGIAGATAVVQPIPVPAEIAGLDIWVMLAAAILLVLFAATRHGVSRLEGALLLLAYGGYIALQFSPALRELVGLA
jgi:cation:H+ antiporter